MDDKKYEELIKYINDRDKENAELGKLVREATDVIEKYFQGTMSSEEWCDHDDIAESWLEKAKLLLGGGRGNE